MKKLFFVILAIVIIGAIVFAIKKPSTPQTNTPNPSNSQNVVEQKDSSATITYSDSGFAPSSISINSGDVVTLTNNSSRNLELSSDPHPVHTKNQELNQSIIASGQSQRITLTTTGTWGYHNHLDSRHTGTIVVK